jgi:hypothetical protein
MQLRGMPLEELTERLTPFEGHGEHRMVVNGRMQCALRGRTQGLVVNSHAQSIAPGPKSVRETPSTAAVSTDAMPGAATGSF